MSSPLYDDATPDEVKNAKGIHLITANTPNGQIVQILLEELKEVYGTEWTTGVLNLKTAEQKKDWFLRLNPNGLLPTSLQFQFCIYIQCIFTGKIPILIDNTHSVPFPIMESGAELVYLQATYDANHEFGFKNPLEWSQALQWLFFWHGGGSPNLAQYAHFARTQEKIPYAIGRFKDTAVRVIGVLEIHLSGKYTNEPREYLAGDGKGKYSIADMSAWPWVKELKSETWREGFDLPEHLSKYIDRIAQRPAVQRGIGKEYEQ
ncbi:hypothetical protein MMC07_000253 [Pseudocyphellaria aurata]|nr:hypothetical protein [Pseudocyphellaria aurata]